MYPTIYSVKTLSGTQLYWGDNRYEADKALFAANESAQLWVKYSPEPGRVIADNFNVFPDKEHPVSTWIPVTSRLPDPFKWVLVVNDGVIWMARLSDSGEWNEADRMADGLCEVTHWTPLPPLPPLP